MHKKRKNGLATIEVIGLIVMLALIVGVILSKRKEVTYGCRQSKCKANLSQLGKGFSLYLLDFGKQVSYPEESGQGFLLSLCKNKILIEPAVYLCSDTEDTNDKSELLQAFDEGDEDGPVSYAGRKNINQSVYPGIFKLTEETTTTPIASDDIGYPDNHENGTVMNFLFLDGHVDHIRQNDRDFGDILDVLSN